MITLALSAPKAMGFYSQSVSDKLFSIIGNGEKLSLTDAIRLIEIVGFAAKMTAESGITRPWDYVWDSASPNEPLEHFDGFDYESEEWQKAELQLDELLSFSRWLSELAELRHLDYKRAAKTLTPGQLAAPWEV